MEYSVEVITEEEEKRKLAEATKTDPYGVVNVGIFGEGTDSPSLSAVAFLEPRKSAIDVVQAVGRAMRKTGEKDLGYIICPIEIPPDEDPEEFLSQRDPDEGWEVLGQVLQALCAHDGTRIEDELPRLLGFYLPDKKDVISSLIAIADSERHTIKYGLITASKTKVVEVVENCLEGTSMKSLGVTPDPTESQIRDAEPVMIYTGKKNVGGDLDLRKKSTVTDKLKNGTTILNITKSKKRASRMINNREGNLVTRTGRGGIKADPTKARQLTLLEKVRDEYGDAIRVNLLSKSGIARSRVERDTNLLEATVMEASWHLRRDGLTSVLNKHFYLDHLKDENLAKQGDGCVIAALLMMNAAMLHQRIYNDQSIRDLQGIINLSDLKSAPDVINQIEIAWKTIRSHDFQPIITPSLRCFGAIRNTKKHAGLERALHHICEEVERVSDLYDDIVSDHAGALFNRVMGNQVSDGAFFTRAPIAVLAARLTLDAIGEGVNWSDEEAWHENKVVDLAGGTGTLLRAMLTDMLRRARENGMNSTGLARLQKIGVEKTIKGLDINEVSLQFASSQLTTGSKGVSYRRMGLHLMPYGPIEGNVSIGSLEMLRQSRMLPDPSMLYPDDTNHSEVVWGDTDNDEVVDVIDDVKGSRIVIMNPPFTNRNRMGGKFPKEVQVKLRAAVDIAREKLIGHDPALTTDSLDKNSVQPMFTALADLCIPRDEGVLSMIVPTIALTAPSGETERKFLAERYHIHLIMTSHVHNDRNMAGEINANHSLVVCKRRKPIHDIVCSVRPDAF